MIVKYNLLKALNQMENKINQGYRVGVVENISTKYSLTWYQGDNTLTYIVVGIDEEPVLKYQPMDDQAELLNRNSFNKAEKSYLQTFLDYFVSTIQVKEKQGSSYLMQSPKDNKANKLVQLMQRVGQIEDIDKNKHNYIQKYEIVPIKNSTEHLVVVKVKDTKRKYIVYSVNQNQIISSQAINYLETVMLKQINQILNNQ